MSGCLCTGACRYGGGCAIGRFVVGPPIPRPCDHCYCIPVMVNGIAHKRCCNCGSQKIDMTIASGSVSFSSNVTISSDTFSGDWIH